MVSTSHTPSPAPRCSASTNTSASQAKRARSVTARPKPASSPSGASRLKGSELSIARLDELELDAGRPVAGAQKLPHRLAIDRRRIGADACSRRGCVMSGMTGIEARVQRSAPAVRSDPARMTKHLDAAPPPRILIVGAGFGGIAAAIELRRHGFDQVRSWRRRPSSGARGSTTATRARRATCPAICTRSPTPSALTGRGCARPRPRSSATCARSPPTTASTGWCRPRSGSPSACSTKPSAPLAGADRGRRDLRGRGARARHRPAQPARDPAPARARDASPATASTRRAGTTTTTCAASAWR